MSNKNETYAYNVENVIKNCIDTNDSCGMDWKETASDGRKIRVAVYAMIMDDEEIYEDEN